MISEVVAREVQRALRGMPLPVVGTVVEVDWKQQMARIRVATNGMETGWLRIVTGFASGGDGAVAPLVGGDDVVAWFMGGDMSGQGFIAGRVYGANGVPELPEQALGAKRGQHKVLFGADGKQTFNVQEFKVEAVGEASFQGATAELKGTNSVSVTSSGQASMDGTQVVLGGGVSGAVKFEELSVALTPWTTAVQLAFQALGVTLPVIVLAPARATKVTVG